MSGRRLFLHAIWPNQNGAGFDLMLVGQISVSGHIVYTERKEKHAEQAAA